VKSFDAVLDRQTGRKFVGSLASPFLLFLPGVGATFSKLLVTLTSDEVDRGVSSQAMQADDACKETVKESTNVALCNEVILVVGYSKHGTLIETCFKVMESI
jgi:hypothetical protein